MPNQVTKKYANAPVAEIYIYFSIIYTLTTWRLHFALKKSLDIDLTCNELIKKKP